MQLLIVDPVAGDGQLRAVLQLTMYRLETAGSCQPSIRFPTSRLSD